MPLHLFHTIQFNSIEWNNKKDEEGKKTAKKIQKDKHFKEIKPSSRNKKKDIFTKVIPKFEEKWSLINMSEYFTLCIYFLFYFCWYLNRFIINHCYYNNYYFYWTYIVVFFELIYYYFSLIYIVGVWLYRENIYIFHEIVLCLKISSHEVLFEEQILYLISFMLGGW